MQPWTLLSVLAVLCLLLLCRDVAGAETAAKKKKSSSKSKTSKSESSSSTFSSASKIEVLAKLMQNNPIVSLTDRNFPKYITDRPRDYHSVLVLTATDPKYGCSVCVKGKQNLEGVAKLYQSQFNFSAVATPEERVVFFVAEVDDARNIFTELRVETVPRVFILPPADSKSRKTLIQEYEVDGRPLLESLQASIELVNYKTGLKILILQDPFLLLLILSIVAMLLALFVSNACYDVSSALLWYQEPKLWVVVSLICFGVGVSGSIFCIIRSAPPFGFNRLGVMNIFAPQGRDQFLIEGIIVALWTVGAGLSLFLMQQATKLKFPVLRHILVLFLFSVFIVLAQQIWTAYIAKTPWYSMRETLPSPLWQYLTSGVKKNSDIFKRFVRMSEIWLFDEAKDFEGLKKKFQQLVVDYLQRVFTQFVSGASAGKA